jgi:hypothetical protein
MQLDVATRYPLPATRYPLPATRYNRISFSSSADLYTASTIFSSRT